MQRQIITMAFAATVAVGVFMASTNPAEAGRKRCVFMAHDASGHVMADGWAKAFKLSTACRRAERRCNRELNRKRRQGKAGRGSCIRIINL